MVQVDLSPRGFGGDKEEHLGQPLLASITPGFQGNPYDGKLYDWQGLVPAHKRDDSVIKLIVNQLSDIEPKIEERMKVAVELWKARHPDDTLNVDYDELLKDFQQRFSEGDELVEATLMCLHELGRLKKDRHEWVSHLRKARGSENIDVCPQGDLSDGFQRANGHRFHVVIVGINKYYDPQTPALQGCVNDALLFYNYAIHDLSVPADQIMLLLSPLAPTRENILNALYDLHDNPNIKPDDSIIIFYAGHGQSYRAAGYTPRNTGSIEAISPVDRRTPKLNTDMTEEMIVDISDREINVILGEIAKKCPNITLILDCCHGGGGSRGSDSAFTLGDKEFLTSRYCPAIPSAVPLMFKAADEARRLSPDRPRTASPNFKANMKSHVLIAAAKEYEEAHEFIDKTTGTIQGYFTSRFLSVLRSPLGLKPATTYRDVIGSPGLVMPFQTAFIAGKKTARLWFA
ncbi:caspase domain-containing protein [Rhodocollybia butyracea]|uniref:Caspase domain-containing protein n=1 Tax=Rhodocollybia butyracea TaxID=206335 RepID=A0A9P5PLW2_9AGAR|nr:caspase domain-containing protein [Rhodocollybia butyracea]